LARRSVHIGVSWVEPKAAPLALRVYGTRCKRSPKAVDLPRWIAPQLTQLSAAAPSGPQWVHEIKLDGFRMAARIERGRPQLLTRTGLDWTDKYPSVVAALANIRVKAAYLDGELCGDGLPSFSQTQAASDGERGVRLVYYAFDLLHLDGRDTASLPLIERKALLEPLIAGTPGLQFNGHESGDGEIVRQHACKLGFEGVVSKTIDAPYAPGNRGLWRSPNASTGRNSLSLAGRTPKGRGPISARSCLATTLTTAGSSMPGAWVRECQTRCWRTCDSGLSRWRGRDRLLALRRPARRGSDPRLRCPEFIGLNRSWSQRLPT
jgi:ATP dependent DNA ligase domain